MPNIELKKVIPQIIKIIKDTNLRGTVLLFLRKYRNSKDFCIDVFVAEHISLINSLTHEHMIENTESYLLKHNLKENQFKGANEQIQKILKSAKIPTEFFRTLWYVEIDLDSGEFNADLSLVKFNEKLGKLKQ